MNRTFLKTFVVFLLSCVSVFAADTNDVQVITTLNTNTQPAILITKKVYLRGGQTNLVSDTRTKDGVLQNRTQEFYYNGLLVGGYATFGYGYSSAFSAENAPCMLSFNFDSSNKMQWANLMLMRTNKIKPVILDIFTCTNGVFYPADKSVLSKAKKDMESFVVH